MQQRFVILKLAVLLQCSKTLPNSGVFMKTFFENVVIIIRLEIISRNCHELGSHLEVKQHVV